MAAKNTCSFRRLLFTHADHSVKISCSDSFRILKPFVFVFYYNEPHFQYKPPKHKRKMYSLIMQYIAIQNKIASYTPTKKVAPRRSLTFNQKNARTKTIKIQKNRLLIEKSLIYSESMCYFPGFR